MTRDEPDNWFTREIPLGDGCSITGCGILMLAGAVILALVIVMQNPGEGRRQDRKAPTAKTVSVPPGKHAIVVGGKQARSLTQGEHRIAANETLLLFTPGEEQTHVVKIASLAKKMDRPGLVFARSTVRARLTFQLPGERQLCALFDEAPRSGSMEECIQTLAERRVQGYLQANPDASVVAIEDCLTNYFGAERGLIRVSARCIRDG